MKITKRQLKSLVEKVIEESNTSEADGLVEDMSQKTDIIDYIDQNPDATNQEIADALGIKKNNVAGIKSRLRKEGHSLPREKRRASPKASGTVAPTPEVEDKECTVEDAYNTIEGKGVKSPAEYFGYEVSNVVREFSDISKETFFEALGEDHDEYMGDDMSRNITGMDIYDVLDMYEEYEGGDAGLDFEDVVQWLLDNAKYYGHSGMSKDDLKDIIDNL